jgi:hypothetical protein
MLGQGRVDGKALLGRTLRITQQRSLVARLERSAFDLDPRLIDAIAAQVTFEPQPQSPCVHACQAASTATTVPFCTPRRRAQRRPSRS